MSNSGHTTACHPFQGQPWTVISLSAIGIIYTSLMSYLALRYCRGNGIQQDFEKVKSWRYRLPGWPKEYKIRGSVCLLFTWRFLCLILAISCIVFQYLPIHYYSHDGVYNTTEPPHSSMPAAYRFYTVWNFHLVFFYFLIGTYFSYQGLMATKMVTDVQQIVIEPYHESAYFEKSAGLPKLVPSCLEKIQHIIMNVEMACTPLICLIVWTVLFEGVEKEDGLPEAIIKFINFDNLVQHLTNVFMMWIDFYLNDLSIISSHFLFMYAWMLTYTLFHSIIWIKTCFLAYPFMDLTTPLVFVWFVAISSLHMLFYGIAIYCSKKKRMAMDRAHNIDPTKLLLDPSDSSVGSSIQDWRDGRTFSDVSGGDSGSYIGIADSAWSRGVNENEQKWGSEVNSSSYLMMPSSF